MSEHIWVTEHIAAYVADGLNTAERERVDTHAAECETCAQALAELRSLDTTVENLFVGERPTPALEDRMICVLRAHRPHKSWSIGLRVAASVAALVALGAIGTIGTGLLAEGTLRFPGTSADEAVAWVDEAKALSLEPLAEIGNMVWRSENEVAGGGGTGGSGSGGGKGSGSGAGMSASDEGYKLNASLEERRQAGADSARKKWEESLNDALAPTGGKSRSHGASTGLREAPPFPRTPAARADAPKSLLSNAYTFPQVSGVATGDKAPHLYAPVDFDAANAPPAANPAVPVPAKPMPAKDGMPREMTKVPMPQSSDGQSSDPFNGSNTAPTEKKPVGVGSQLGAPLDDLGAPPLEEQMPVPQATGDPAATRQVVIRSGEVEFEITSFDDAVGTVTRLVGAIKGGFIATVNSEKLPNGKVRGAVVVRVPPERLDSLVLDLRKELTKTGDLKSQRVGSQDITKQYTDIESRLRAARAMEERLLNIIKDGKGEIKDLVAAEKELGNWRTQIETLEGELRYYSNLVALSTLTINLYEKEIRAASAIKETETINMGIEVEDVEKAHRDALAAITEFKGRIVKAELKQLAAGQFNAVLQFEASPESAGPLRDRLKQLGNVARMQIDRVRSPEGGTGNPSDGKVDRVDTVFIVSLYNLIGLAPRETVILKLVATDAEAAYKQLLARAQKATGKILSSQLNSQRAEQTHGRVQFEVKTAEADAVLADLRNLGEIMSMQTTETPEGANVTRAKQGFLVEVWALAAVQPRETVAIDLAMRDVPAGFRTLQDAVAKAKGRVINAQLNEQDRTNVTGEFDFEIARGEEAALRAALASVGEVYSRNVTRAADSESVIDSKVRWTIKLMNVTAIPPSETVSLDLEVKEVEPAVAAFTSYVMDSKGRVVNSSLTHDPSGRVTASAVYDVPLAAAPGLIERLKASGVVRGQQIRRNSQAKESDLAVARLEVSLVNEQRIVPKDEGLWTQVRKGLATSFVAISWSVVVVIIGLCFVLPWFVVGYIAYLIWRRVRRQSQTA